MINYPFSGRDTGYCYYTINHRRVLQDNTKNEWYGIKCKEDDIVSMIVDLESYQIKYKVNDQD